MTTQGNIFVPSTFVSRLTQTTMHVFCGAVYTLAEQDYINLDDAEDEYLATLKQIFNTMF